MSVLFAAFLAFAKFIFSIIKDDFMQVKLFGQSIDIALWLMSRVARATDIYI